MENASQALLIAGAVLLAILVASFGVYFSKNIANNTARIYNQLEESRRTEFNQQFLKFNEKTDLNIQDIVTIINLAKDSNKENGLEKMTPPAVPDNDKTRYVKIDFKNSSYDLGNTTYKENLQTLSSENINSLIDEEMKKTSDNKFKCTVYINNNTGYVNYIEIE